MTYGLSLKMISVCTHLAIKSRIVSMEELPIKDAVSKDHSPEELEEDLYLLFQQGDDTAFDKIVEHYREMVYFVSYRILRNSESALDATQEVFIKLHKCLPGFKGKSKLRTWIYRITVNHCINILRSEAKKKETLSLDDTFQIQDPSSPHPRKELENAEIKEKILWAVAQLPPQQRTIFVLKNFNELTFCEIAESMNRSVGAVKAGYFHAIQKMRDLLVKGRADYE